MTRASAELRDGGGPARIWSGALLLFAVVFSVVGGILLAMADTRPLEPSPSKTAVPPPPTTLIEQIIVMLSSPAAGPTATPVPTLKLPLDSTPSFGLLTGVAGICSAPAGWVPYTVFPGDTLIALAIRAGVTAELVKAGNCLASDIIHAGDVLALPAGPLPSPTCGPPSAWTLYTIQPGDTLFSLARARGVTVYDVLVANCRSSTWITVGNRIFLPALPATDTPTPPPPTSTPTAATPATAAPRPTKTDTPASATLTSTSMPSATPTVAPSPTAVLTATPTPALTATASPPPVSSPTDTSSPTPPATDTPTPSPLPSETPSPTVAPADTPTPTFTSEPPPVITATKDLVLF